MTFKANHYFDVTNNPPDLAGQQHCLFSFSEAKTVIWLKHFQPQLSLFFALSFEINLNAQYAWKKNLSSPQPGKKTDRKPYSNALVLHEVTSKKVSASKLTELNLVKNSITMTWWQIVQHQLDPLMCGPWRQLKAV